MPLRCIMILPDFEEAYRIEAIRERYDPLFGIVKPHISLVFPFGSDLTKNELHAHIVSALSGFRPFPLVMRGISTHRQPDGYYIFLDIAEGAESIRMISERLYEGALQEFKSDRYDTTYVPHITLGRFLDEATLQTALVHIVDFSTEFPTTICNVDVEVIRDDGSSAFEMTFQL